MTADPTLRDAVVDAGQHLGTIIQMLIDGVAFRNDRRSYTVFSHQGDELGTISTADVNYAVNFMKQRGREVGKISHPYWNANFPCGPAFTFAWVGWDSSLLEESPR